jgi:hypothetical protein
MLVHALDPVDAVSLTQEQLATSPPTPVSNPMDIIHLAKERGRRQGRLSVPKNAIHKLHTVKYGSPILKSTWSEAE